MSAARPQCVVLLPAQEKLPRSLYRSLVSREIKTEVFSDSHLAMARLCQLARQRQPRTISGAGLMLIIVEPENNTRLQEFLAAVDRYLPAVVCRSYRVADRPHLSDISAEQLRRLHRQGGPQGGSAPVSPGIPRTSGDLISYHEKPVHPSGHRLRLAGTESAAPLPGADEDENTGKDRGRTELTSEELSMLLADEEIHDEADQNQ
ncbi:MAG TPA: hypothetical protein ENJ06_02260 [Phycisphaeraceae bacterium]|nr:hypothetical protein [Phycisphaeraceae bacterium]